jgi:predicted Kef-type K+ transport protein
VLVTETSEFFLHLAIILITARFFAEVSTRLGARAVIGELFAGILLGPSLLGVIALTDTIRLLAGRGVFQMRSREAQRSRRSSIRRLAYSVCAAGRI